MAVRPFIFYVDLLFHNIFVLIFRKKSALRPKSGCHSINYNVFTKEYNFFMIINTISASVPSDFLTAERLSPRQCLFFDIETTGLSWRRSHLYLLGAVFFENDTWTHRQWFCQRPGEEKEVLQQFAELLNSHTHLIHYNGNTFDVPYLMHKYTFYRLEQSWDHITQLDLYQRMLPCKKILGLEHMRQKDLEAAAGIHREDPFTGGELITCYQEYLQTGDERLYRTLALHNQEDVEGMLKLLALLTIPRLFQGTLTDSVTVSARADNTVLFHVSLKECVPLKLHLETPWYRLDTNSAGCTITVSAFEGTLKYFFPDYKNYYYLPLEDEAIHKSVGAYVDKEHREKAKAANCYKKITGSFLPQFESIFTPEFFREYRDFPRWFSADEQFFSDPARLTAYANHLFKSVRSLISENKNVGHTQK